MPSDHVLAVEQLSGSTGRYAEVSRGETEKGKKDESSNLTDETKRSEWQCLIRMTRDVIHEDNKGMNPASQRHTTERWWVLLFATNWAGPVGWFVGCATGFHGSVGSRIPCRSQCNGNNQIGLVCDSSRKVMLATLLVIGLGWMRMAAMRCDGDTHRNSLLFLPHPTHCAVFTSPFSRASWARLAFFPSFSN